MLCAHLGHLLRRKLRLENLSAHAALSGGTPIPSGESQRGRRCRWWGHVPLDTSAEFPIGWETRGIMSGFSILKPETPSKDADGVLAHVPENKWARDDGNHIKTFGFEAEHIPEKKQQIFMDVLPHVPNSHPKDAIQSTINRALWFAKLMAFLNSLTLFLLELDVSV